MKRTSKRAWSGLMAIAIAASIVPLLSAPAANAAGVPQPGGASIRTAGGGAALNSGNSDTTFTLRLPSGAACGGDSALDGYRVQSYVVPASVDPSTLTFDAAGPIPSGVGAGYRQPLYDTFGSPFVNAQTANAATAGGPGPIINIPDFNYSLFVPGDIPAGAYNIGIACSLGAAGPTQMKEFWNVTKTFTTDAATGGSAQVSWSVGAVPAAPTLTGLTPGDGTLTAAFTAVASTPATTGFTATATGPGGPFTATGASSPITIPGLTNGSAYSVTVRATNSAGNSAESNSLSGTPNPARPPVTGLQGSPDPSNPGSAIVTWSYAGPAQTGFTVTINPSQGTIGSVSGTGPYSVTISGLTPGTLYTATVTPTYASAPAGTPATSSAFTVNSAESVIQDIEVTRPVGALVLTQRCGVYGDLPEAPASPGFPVLPFKPAAATTPGGTAPFEDWDPTQQQGVGTPGTNPDTANFPEYPYPVDEDGPDGILGNDDDGNVDAVYPTHCGVDLGTGKLVTSGSEAGKFFRADGRLNEIKVVDTRDTDDGWSAIGTVSDFTRRTGGSGSFNGNHLGWNPVMTDDSDAYDSDLDGSNDYDQTVQAGAVVLPRTTGAAGLKAGQPLAFTPDPAGPTPEMGLGIATLDARLKLLIPVVADNGRYSATLSFSFL